ncbi:MAG: hypothetical protein H6945_12285 [Zoogloeaceae bacterium]|nr:hypothetical protein [Rhodocyclaceae bacterium]MCP5236504.1 hypothetical protein [Zoogloeaceae bacterium]
MNPSYRIVVSVLLACLLAACAGRPSGPPQQNIAFIDSRIFDDELSRSLQAGFDEVTVETDASVTLAQIPERMDKWLYTVREADHPVVARPTGQPLTRSIGLVALLQAIATGTYDWLRESLTYSPARNYDATLIYDKDSGRVEKVVFRAVPKSARVSTNP